jgi:hypothetical protein
VDAIEYDNCIVLDSINSVRLRWSIINAANITLQVEVGTVLLDLWV